MKQKNQKSTTDLILEKIAIFTAKIGLTYLLFLIGNNIISKLSLNPNPFSPLIQIFLVVVLVYAGFKIWSDKFMSEEKEKRSEPAEPIEIL